MKAQQTVSVGTIAIGPRHPLVVISGPCVIEEREVMRRVASELVEICARAGFPLIFKSSYEKDNRTEGTAYRGPGLSAGLEELGRLKEEFGFPVLSDVHRPPDVAPAARVLDVVQVPALLSRQSSLLEAVGASGQAVNIKKGQFMSPQALLGAVSKVRAAGGQAILVTERGSCFGVDRLVCDFTNLLSLRQSGLPLVVDAGHAANQRHEIPLLACCAVAAGADALYLECHPDPARARCDGNRMLSLEEMRQVLGRIGPLAGAMQQCRG